MKKQTKAQLLKRERRRIKKEQCIQYNIWRSNVYTRDNYTCLICNKYLKDGSKHNMQAHHILDKRNWKVLTTCLNNGITLCYYCHKNSKFSPHLSALAFVELFKEKRPEQYKALLEIYNTLK